MTDDEIDEEVDRLLSHDRLNWLFGAGASSASGLPLMVGLTARVLDILSESGSTIKDGSDVDVAEAQLSANILGELGTGATVEQLLDQVADYLAMAERSQAKLATTSWGKFRNDQLAKLRLDILKAVRTTVSYGYQHDAQSGDIKIGTPTEPIITVEHHIGFFDALFGEVRAGRPRTNCVNIFTTNYDTLLEDSLALSGIPYADGFLGGAVAFWNPESFARDDARVRVLKLHGSVDWTTFQNKRIVRRRPLDRYPDAASDLLIYPQASKYEFARREPYDTVFQRFRNCLLTREGQVLAVCGYGFGDRHIDSEIEQAMARPESDLTLVVFSKSVGDQLKIWQQMSFSERMYVLTEEGVYRGADLYRQAPAASPHDWWTFEGMTKRLRNVRLAAGNM